MNQVAIGLITLAAADFTFALSMAEQDRLIKAVSELCYFPDKVSEQIRFEGGASVGAPVIMKILKADISGKVAYDTWKGFGVALDKYKTDPRQCAIEITKLLLPSFLAQSVAPTPASQASRTFLAKFVLRRGSLDETYYSEPFPEMLSLIVSNKDTGTTLAFVRFKNEAWSPSSGFLKVSESQTRIDIEVRATYPGGGTSHSYCDLDFVPSPAASYELRGYLTDDFLAVPNIFGGGLIYTPPGAPNSPYIHDHMRGARLINCAFGKVAARDIGLLPMA